MIEENVQRNKIYFTVMGTEFCYKYFLVKIFVVQNIVVVGGGVSSNVDLHNIFPENF